ncbi:unnamed protein product [Mycena citricolor]|uniref:Endonuclease/exonuclease/phosphatase domain-containing protein n=1 Tax=Mycena citricolor TaxID=2018698 RepID=A0AAD2Q514_9AGAR|nr:unnamed protein product [Mycena citricolor]
MTYYKKRPDFDVTLRSDLAQDLDIQIIEVSRQNGKRWLYANVYNEGGHRPASAERLQQVNLPQDTPTIFLGDWNLHHKLWSCTDKNGNRRSNKFVEWMMESDTGPRGILLNEKGAVTFTPHNNMGSSSVLDLVFANSKAAAEDTLQEWTIDRSMSYGSDHHGIRWTTDDGRTEINNITGAKYIMKDVNPEDWGAAFRQELDARQQDINKIMDPDPQVNITNEQLEQAATALTEAMQAATARVAKIRRPSNQAKPWWNEDLQKAAKDLSNVQEELKTFEEVNGVRSLPLRQKVKKMSNFLKRLCKATKTKWAVEKLQEATSDTIWSFRNWSSGARNYPSPPIKRRGQGPAITHTEKCEALRAELFQPPPELEAEYIRNLTDTLPDDLEYQEVTEEEVREAIFESSSNSAPGSSQITYQTLRWAWGSASQETYTLIRLCLRNGFHPKQWRQAVAVALRKPRKPDYSEPRAYRLIQLLECMGKVLEKVVARRLTYLAGKHRLIPVSQTIPRSGDTTSSDHL